MEPITGTRKRRLLDRVVQAERKFRKAVELIERARPARVLNQTEAKPKPRVDHRNSS